MDERFNSEDLGKKVLLYLEVPILLGSGKKGNILSIEDGEIISLEENSITLKVNRLDMTSLPYEMRNKLEEFPYNNITKFRYL